MFKWIVGWIFFTMLTLYGAVEAMCNVCFNIDSSCCPHVVFTSFIGTLYYTANLYLNLIKRLTFVTVMRCVSLEIGTDILNMI